MLRTQVFRGMIGTTAAIQGNIMSDAAYKSTEAEAIKFATDRLTKARDLFAQNRVLGVASAARYFDYAAREISSGLTIQSRYDATSYVAQAVGIADSAGCFLDCGRDAISAIRIAFARCH